MIASGERLAVQEAAVRPAVDDVERRLEHAEERQRRPEQERARRRSPSAAALSWSVWTSLRMRRRPSCRGTRGCSSVTRKLDSSARSAKPSSASARKSSGTNESSAKYAIIAARCVPRSAKNFATSFRLRSRTSDSIARVGFEADGRRAGTRRPDRDLVADRGRRALRRADGSVDAGRRSRDARRSSRRAARAARGRRRSSQRRAAVVQLEAATADGSVFVVRDGDRVVAATTGAEPTVGLVFYDLKSCLRASAESDEPAKPKRAPERKPKEADDDEA